MPTRYLKYSLFLSLAVLGCGGAVDLEAQTEQPIRHEGQLAHIVDVLDEAGCTTADATVSLKTALQRNGRRARRELRRALRSGVCDAGAELILAVLRSRTAPLFEGQRIIFDADRDRCLDSVFDTTSLTARLYDADGDGCFDRIWDAEGLIAELDIDPALGAELALGAQAVAGFLFEPPVELREPDFDWFAYRAQAEPTLFALIDHARVANAPMLVSFLENTQGFVVGFSGCRDDVEALPMPGAPQPGLHIASTSNGLDASDAVQKWFYIYTTRGHSWVGLEAGDKKYARGLYKGGYGKGTKATKVPKSKQLPNAGSTSGGNGNGGGGSSGSSDSSGSSSDSSADSSGGTFNGPGYVADEAGGGWYYRACYKIDDKQWDKAVKRINSNIDTSPEYRYFSRNCMGWAAGIAGLLGVTVADHTYFGVPDPDTLADSLKSLADNGKTGGADRVESNGAE